MRVVLFFFFICVSISINAEDCFKLNKSDSQCVYRTDNGTITSNTAYYPFPNSNRISGMAITGQITKCSPEYVVRVILKDREGQEYLIMEAYEELNDGEIIRFEDYAEETLSLSDVEPDSIKVYIKGAKLQINSVTVNNAKSQQAMGQCQKAIRTRQVSSIVERINEYNKRKERPWIAGETELSKQPYIVRKRLLGLSDDTSSGGIEYYVGGYFVVGHGEVQPNRQTENDPFVDSFDWRNRHGKNWITSVKHQGFTAYCVPFGALGCTEALTRLYYNNADLEIDLSEQEIASCADTVPHKFYQGFKEPCVLNYIYEHGVCDEAVYPLDTIGYDSLSYVPICYSGVIEPNEWVKTGSPATYIDSNLQDIKRQLITKGPLLSGWYGPPSEPGHAMALVGYGKIKATDTYEYFNSNTHNIETRPASDAYIGTTYWIFKNSCGDSVLHGGYYYLIFSPMVGNNGNVYISDMITPYSLGLPITTLSYNDDDIIIEDADGDGFYNWGIGEKPQGCPSWIPNDRDGDDSDPTKSFMNAYGHLANIADRVSGHWTLSSDFTYNYNSNILLYDDIIIPYGRTLTVSSPVVCIGNATITVQDGGHLVIDGGILANAKINLSSSSYFTILNGGLVYMRKNCDFSAPFGSTVEVVSGEINGPYIKKSAKWE